MSGFIANASRPAASADVESGAFWPAINIENLRSAVRLEGNVTEERLRMAVVNAVISVNDELRQWRAVQEAAGATSLAQVPGDQVDGQSRLVQLYRRAVYCNVGVEITERFRSYDATAQGNQRAEDLQPTIDELRRDVRYAISDILGTRRVTVELI